MNIEEIEIATGINEHQSASYELHDKMIDFEPSKNLSYSDIITLSKGLNLISEFYDVNAVISINAIGICGAALGKTLEDAVNYVIDSNPIDFISSTVCISKEVDSDLAKMLKDVHIVAAPSFTKNAKDYLETHGVVYVQIKTPLKEYKKYLSNTEIVTPLGKLIQSPNLSELNKDSFKVVSKTKPTVEQIEDAVFAWKIAKHANSKAIIIAKDLKTTAIAQGLQSASVEYALDSSCDRSKDAILASDLGITLHDFNVAIQGRIALLVIPCASKELIALADKYNVGIIVTGLTNLS